MHMRVNIFIASVSKAAVLLCLMAVIGSAAVPTLTNYQGFLRDANGDPVNVPVNVTFTIYDELDNVVWTETQNSVPVTEGSFNVLLGVNTPIDAGDFSCTERYLGLSINGDLEMIPRTRLVSQPYAFRLETVDGATGGTISGDLALSGGNVGLDPSSVTAGNILKSGMPFLHNYGADNTFVGLEAGNLTMTGLGGNTAIGTGAFATNTTGRFNTAAGFQALGGNTTGTYNTASGLLALSSNTEGTGNTASGSQTLYSNTTGYANTANGIEALLRNTTGYNNTASGARALYYNTTGNRNTASGEGALFYNTTGVENAACGHNALLANTIGLYNTASGVAALGSNTTASNNTASGAYALRYNTTGSENTACGLQALLTNTTGSNNTAIGYNADVSTGDLTNATAIGASAVADASNKIRLGSTAVTVLECQVGLTVISDKTQKENFQPVDGNEVLNKIRELDLSSWNLIGHDPKQFRHYGPMAQEFFAAFGHDEVGTIGTATTINSQDVAGILMIAVQALEKRTAEVDDIKAENADLRSQIADLREMIRAQAANPK